eukprot:SAG31_NODE_1618_length_7732_cov_28.468361_2_plen_86_part_00
MDDSSHMRLWLYHGLYRYFEARVGGTVTKFKFTVVLPVGTTKFSPGYLLVSMVDLQLYLPIRVPVRPYQDMSLRLHVVCSKSGNL